MFSSILNFIIKKLRIKYYNTKNNTKIKSRFASLNSYYGKGVLIGKDTFIDENCSIGDYSYVNKNSSIENTTIGKYCSISSSVNINPYEHNYKRFTTHPFIRETKNEDIRKKVIIGNDVLISLNVIIITGVNIGDGSVIGAGSVVTKDVHPYEIVAGVPAKHIGWRFSEKEINKLKEISWWDLERDEIKSMFNY